MRRLGSYFHVAMNGMAASDKIFKFLSEDEPAERTVTASDGDIELKDVYVLKKEATIDKSKNFYVSDHFPVYAEFYHKNKK